MERKVIIPSNKLIHFSWHMTMAIINTKKLLTAWLSASFSFLFTGRKSCNIHNDNLSKNLDEYSLSTVLHKAQYTTLCKEIDNLCKLLVRAKALNLFDEFKYISDKILYKLCSLEVLAFEQEVKRKSVIGNHFANDSQLATNPSLISLKAIVSRLTGCDQDNQLHEDILPFFIRTKDILFRQTLETLSKSITKQDIILAENVKNFFITLILWLIILSFGTVAFFSVKFAYNTIYTWNQNRIINNTLESASFNLLVVPPVLSAKIKTEGISLLEHDTFTKKDFSWAYGPELTVFFEMIEDKTVYLDMMICNPTSGQDINVFFNGENVKNINNLHADKWMEDFHHYEIELNSKKGLNLLSIVSTVWNHHGFVLSENETRPLAFAITKLSIRPKL